MIGTSSGWWDESAFCEGCVFLSSFLCGTWNVHSQVSTEKYKYRNELIILSSVPVYGWIWIYRGIHVSVVLISTSVKKKIFLFNLTDFYLLVHVIASCLSNICTTTGSLVGMCNCKPKYQWLSKQAIYIMKENCFSSNCPITIREIQKYRPCVNHFISPQLLYPNSFFGIVI